MPGSSGLYSLSLWFISTSPSLPYRLSITIPKNCAPTSGASNYIQHSTISRLRFEALSSQLAPPHQRLSLTHCNSSLKIHVSCTLFVRIPSSSKTKYGRWKRLQSTSFEGDIGGPHDPKGMLLTCHPLIQTLISPLKTNIHRPILHASL